MALDTFIRLAGDRDVVSYTRDDAKLFADVLLSQGNKTAIIRRRINCISAILNYAYAELDVVKRNPFSRLFIKGEGHDAHKRGTFTLEQLKQGYDHALSSGSQVKLLMPLLGDTGCRLAEIVGLELDDIDMAEEVIHVRTNGIRRLKTDNSMRTLPLVGYAKEAMILALQHADDQCLYPRYLKGGTCRTTHASNALGKWLKKDETIEQEVSLLSRLKDELGDQIELMVDYNQGLIFDQAFERCKELDYLGLTWIEEPILADILEKAAELTAATKTPIQLGENLWSLTEVKRALNLGSSDYLMPDVAKIGGATQWLRAAKMAERLGAKVSSHLYPEISAHLMASISCPLS